MEPVLHARSSGGGLVSESAPGDGQAPGRWRMEIPAGPAGAYRWAQLDDYMHLPRRSFLWRAPLRLSLRARVSAGDLPGTWGFGLWNDPFSASLGLGGASWRLPALPNTAWFFYAGPPNYLALRDTHPAQGFLAATFASPRLPAPLLAPGALALPLLAIRPAARALRRLAACLIDESAGAAPGSPLEWCTYSLEWQAARVSFMVDGQQIFTAAAAPRGPLGLVIWIDNQYAAFQPSGKLSMGTSESPAPAWLEVESIQIDE